MPEGVSKPKVRGRTMIYAFVTFRSMEGVEIFQRSYDTFNSKYKRALYTACGCCCPAGRYHLKSLYIDGRWPSPKNAILPDNIFWENLGVGPFSRCIRKNISTLLGTIILIGAIVCIIGIGSASKTFEAQQDAPESCPTTDITKEEARDDHYDYGDVAGLVHCFCLKEISVKLNVDALSMLFKDGDEDSKLCQTWAQSYYALKYLKTLESVSVVLINVIATLIFEGLGSF